MMNNKLLWFASEEQKNHDTIDKIVPEEKRQEQQTVKKTNKVYVHLDLTVESLSGKGDWTGSGLCHFFWIQYNNNNSSNKVIIGLENLTDDLGCKVMGKSEVGEAIFLEPNKGRLQGPLRKSSGNGYDLFECMECSQVNIDSISFYPTNAIVHMVYSFKDGKFTQPHLVSSTSPFDRRALRLELSYDPDFNPAGKKFSEGTTSNIRFVAHPFDLLVSSLTYLAPGVANTLHKPIETKLSKSAGSEWSLGPRADFVLGVDFSLSLSNRPIYTIPIERDRQPFTWKAFIPVYLCGFFACFGFYYAMQNNVDQPVWLPPIIGILGVLLLGILHGFILKTTMKGFFVKYLTFSVVLFGAVLGICSTVSDLDALLDCLVVFQICWLLFNCVLYRAVEREIVRGTWEQAVSDAKATSKIPTNNNNSKSKVVPISC